VGKSPALISSEDDLGTSLIPLTRDGDACAAAERWVSRSFNKALADEARARIMGPHDFLW
jgi:hypothetical protein